MVHTGLRSAHLGLKAETQRWIANWISQQINPLKTSTALGHVGRLKLSDSIVFRIAPESGEQGFPPLLNEATYNLPSTTNWEADNRAFPYEQEHADTYRWEFTELPVETFPEAKIYREFDRENVLIPVPPQLAEINELAALQVQMSDYGTIQGMNLIPAPYYRIRYQPTGSLGTGPTPTDLKVPVEYEEVMHQIMPDPIPTDEVLSSIHEFFSEFRYTLYQQGTIFQDEPLVHFLTDRKAGHCEYFASATALMLRHLGIPSRYVVGYSVQEWNESLSMYIVRQRHAHAWATAYINGQWVVVDTTPSQWLSLEETQTGMLQPVWDFFSNNQFRFQIWRNEQRLEDYQTELYIIGFILAIILIWRIATSEQVIIKKESSAANLSFDTTGEDSPFFQVEEQLTTIGLCRSRSELMSKWLLRIEHPELLPMLITHNRWRFDPNGISMQDQQILLSQVQEWLTENTTPVTS